MAMAYKKQEELKVGLYVLIYIYIWLKIGLYLLKRQIKGELMRKTIAACLLTTFLAGLLRIHNQLLFINPWPVAVQKELKKLPFKKGFEKPPTTYSKQGIGSLC